MSNLYSQPQTHKNSGNGFVAVLAVQSKTNSIDENRGAFESNHGRREN